MAIVEITEPYITLAAFKKFLEKPEDETTQDEVLTDIILMATRLVVGYAHRYFAETEATLTFDAPFGSVLPVPDLRAVTSFTFYTTVNWSAGNYLLLPYDGPPYNELQRMVLDEPESWQTGGAGSEFGKLVIAGMFGKTETPDIDVQRATEIFAAHLWHNRQGRYTRNIASTSLGGLQVPPELVTAEIDDLLREQRLILPLAL